MTIDGPSPEAVRYVAQNMRVNDCKEFLAVSHAKTKADLAALMERIYASHPDAICAFADGEPVAVGAMVIGRPNVVTLMFFATDRMRDIAFPLTRFIRQRLFPRYQRAGVHRIECVSIDGYDEAHRWIKALGLAREATLPGFGKAGETFHQFAWVKSDVCPSGA